MRFVRTRIAELVPVLTVTYILNNITTINFGEAQRAMLSTRSEMLNYEHSDSSSSEDELCMEVGLAGTDTPVDSTLR